MPPGTIRRVIGLLCLAAAAHAQDPAAIPFTGPALDLDRAPWKYRSGDDRGWASPNLDDRDWETLSGSAITLERMPAGGWRGVGWFRIRIQAAAAYAMRPLALVMVHYGASEIYLDGRLIQRFGTVGSTPDTEAAFNPNTWPVAIALDSRPGGHLLAIRHSSMELGDLASGRARWLVRQSQRPVVSAYTNRTTNYGAGFGMRVMEAGHAQAAWAQRNTEGGRYLLNFGLLLAIGLLHLLLFWFYPRQRANLFFGLFACAAAGGNIIYYRWSLSHQSATAILLLLGLNIALTQAGLAALLGFLYAAFDVPARRWFRIWLAAAALYVPVSMIFVEMGEIRRWYSHALMLFPVVEVVRATIAAARRRMPGAWVVGAGLLAYTVYVALGSMALLRGLSASEPSATGRSAAVLAITVAISIFLAGRLARVSLAEADLRVRHERERLENERRGKELDEARQLQLSMLPNQVPQLPDFEIAAYMKPASEVGGDYYDFHVNPEDSTLTIAVGDATGHGMKAGTMVTATKSLFASLAGRGELPGMLEHKNAALKQMKLRGMFMAMAIVKIRANRMSLCNAGMPPLLIYRQATGTVESGRFKSPPLGAIAGVRYKVEEMALSAGDVMILMSDGFPERFNEGGEMFDYGRAREEFLAAVAQGSPQAIIQRLVHTGDQWGGGRPQDDDVTFVVLKARGAAEHSPGAA